MIASYIVKLTTTGDKYTTRLVPGPDWKPEEVDQIVSGICGAPPAKCREILSQYIHTLFTGDQPRGIRDLAGGLHFRPTSGGVSDSVNGFRTADDIGVDMIVGFAPEVITAWRTNITIQKVGEEGLAVPVLDAIHNGLSDNHDTYTALQMIAIFGNRLGFDKSLLQQGAFIATGENGPWVRLMVYGPVTEQKVYVLIPAGTTGPIRIKIVNRALHETVYSEVLTAEPGPA